MNSKNKKRVLILRAGRLGDMIMSSAVMDAIDQIFGHACHYDWLLLKPFASIFKMDSQVKRVIPLTLSEKKRALFLSPAKRSLVTLSKEKPYDLVVNLEHDGFFDQLMQKVIANKKIGRPYTAWVAKENDHQVIRDCKILEPLGYSPKRYSVNLRFYPLSFELANQKLRLPVDKYIVLSIATSASIKNKFYKRGKSDGKEWPIEYWLQLIQLISGSSNTKVILVGTQNDAHLIPQNYQHSKSIIMLFGKTTVLELSAILKHARAAVTTDTGTSHIAAAVKCPLVTLFGPTTLEKTKPYHVEEAITKVLSVRHKNKYTPYLPDTPLLQTMSKIKPDMVFEALQDLLSGN